MNLVRWTPTYDILNTMSEVDRVFNDVLGAGFGPRLAQGQEVNFLPVDIYRSEDTLYIQASVPGFAPDEVNISVDGGVLNIEAEHETKENAETSYLRRERPVGAFRRQISLGEALDGDKASASFDNGVVTVAVPVLKKPEPRRIPVNITS
jgi:HSP20 family protein